jgi:hypothetical protein
MYGPFVVTTPIVSTTRVGEQSIYLNSGRTANVTFVWNTAGFAYGIYNLTAFAPPLVGETDLSDNMLTAGTLTITIPGDITGNFFVNAQDVGPITANWLKTAPPAPANADISDDGFINAADVGPVAANWQKHA